MVLMDVTAIAAAGVDAAQARFEKAATGVVAAAGGSDAGGVDTVSLSDATVALLSAKNEFSANIRVAHVADDMQKTVLNLLA